MASRITNTFAFCASGSSSTNAASPPRTLPFAKLLEVPETITRTLTQFAPDGAPIEAHRRAVGRALEKLGR
ncbi:MAG TPA: hypothetical protein P5233_12935 [Candidatus Paceibacterota bacterium]|nr:hypothetical protein [Candidatus Paceibacterota bacterium]